MFCENCGKPLEEGQMFCEECGHPVIPDSKEEKKPKKENNKREKNPNKFRNYALTSIAILACASLLAFGIMKILSPKEEKNVSDGNKIESVTNNETTNKNLNGESKRETKNCAYTVLASNTNNQLLVLDSHGEIKQNTYENVEEYDFTNRITGSYCYLEQNGNLYYITKDREEAQLIDQDVEDITHFSVDVNNEYEDAVDRIFYFKNNGDMFFWSQKFGSVKIESEKSMYEAVSSFSASYMAFRKDETYIVSIENKTEQNIGLKDINLIAIDDKGTLIYQDSEHMFYSYSNGTVTLLGDEDSVGKIDVLKQTYLKLDQNNQLKEVNYVNGTETLIEEEVLQCWIIDPFSNEAVHSSIGYYGNYYKESEEYVIRKQDGNCYYKKGADGELTLLFDCNGYKVSNIIFDHTKEKVYYTIYEDDYDTKNESMNSNVTESLYYSSYSNGTWSERELIEHSVMDPVVLENGNIAYLKDHILKYWNGEIISILAKEVNDIRSILFSNNIVYLDNYGIQCIEPNSISSIQYITGRLSGNVFYNCFMLNNVIYYVGADDNLYQVDSQSKERNIILENCNDLNHSVRKIEE